MSNEVYTNEHHWREIGGKEVFTAGAAIEEKKIGGKWHWVVTRFEDETLWDDTSLNVRVSADMREELVELDAEDVAADDEKTDGDYTNIVPED